MDVDFAIPLNKDGLMSGEAGYYVVDEVFPARSLPSKVAECRSNLRSEGPHAIIRNSNFDVLFSVLRQFNEVQAGLREEAWDCIIEALKGFTKDVSLIIQEGQMDLETRRHNLNALKMLCYLAVQFTDAFETESTKPSTVIAPVGKKRGKSVSTATKKKAGSWDWDWDDQREEVVALLDQLVTMEIARLWDPPVPEHDFINLVTGCCYKLYENPSVAKSATMKELIVSLLGTFVRKYNHALSASLKIVLLLQHFEHLVQPLAEAVETIATKWGGRIVVCEIIREIGKMDPRDLARDSSGTKAYADFLVELASRVPTLIVPSISLLMCHLDGESYSMRNGILGVLGEIVVQVLSKEELEDSAKKLRDQMLDHLEDHIHDINAYVRSKALQIFLHLCTEKAIPLPRQQHLLEIVIGRLQDKSSIVRKNAVQLLKNFLIYNPFGAKYPINHLKKKLEEETAKLKEMAPHLTEEQGGQVSVVQANLKKTWQALELGVRATVKEYIDQEEIKDDDDGPVEFQGDVDEALPCAFSRIRKLLVDGQHTKALAILKAAMVTWPEHPAFVTEREGELDKESTEESSSQDSCGKDEKQEKDIVSQVNVLKAIFLDADSPVVPANDGGNVSEGASEIAGERPASNQHNADLVNAVSKQQVVVNFLKDYVDFHAQMENSIPVICQLLGSKTTSDVSEAINFFVTAYEFGLTNAIFGVRRMLVLIWSRDSAVKDSVVEAYKGLYLDPPAANQRSKMGTIVKNLITLTQGASTGDLTSLEELLVELMKNDLIPDQVIQILWEMFAMKAPQTTPDESRSALVLLGMLAGAEVDLVRSNIDVLVETGMGPRAEGDFLLARETCLALLKLVKTKKKPGAAVKEPFRLPPSHAIFERLSEVIVGGVWKLDNPHWTPMTEQAINVIYNLAEHPDAVCEKLLKRIMARGVEIAQQNQPDDDQNNGAKEGHEPSGVEASPFSCQSGVLARFLSVSGHVALCQLVHLEGGVLGEIKRRQEVLETEREKERQAKKTKKKDTAADATKNSASNETTIEDELGLTGATADDVEVEYIRKICEHDIVTGHNLLSNVRALLVSVCNNNMKYSEPNLRAAASLALAKFMLVSAEFCEAHLQLLFTILEKSPHPIIRANTIVAMGDLTFRFPNLVEPWTPHLYARLRDESAHVRKNTLMVLTHLILNDMVKVKGQISEMATCLEDKEQRIADLAKLFFLELSKKDNAVYNILPDVISRLSDVDGGVTEEPFRNILRYLFSFISKDRQSESLVEKLCHRLRAARTERQWRDLAFCLSMLSYNEKGIRKLQENFSCYHDKLVEEDVYSSFSVIISKSKKFAKPELKTLVDELEQKFAACHTKGLEDEADFDRAAKASGEAAVRGRKAASVTATPSGKLAHTRKGRTPGPRSRRRQDESDEDEEPKENHPRSLRTPRSAARPPKNSKAKSTSRRRKQMPLFESDSDDDVELFDIEGSEERSGNETNESGSENVNPNVEKKGKTSSNKPTRNSKSESHAATRKWMVT